MLKLTEKHREYWRRNMNLTMTLLVIWFVVTFVMAFFVRPLAEINFFGWPLSFYMAAQGSLVIYILIIWYYAHSMGKLDQEYGVHEGED